MSDPAPDDSHKRHYEKVLRQLTTVLDDKTASSSEYSLDVDLANPKISNISAFYSQRSSSLMSLISAMSQGFGLSDGPTKIEDMDIYKVTPQVLGPPPDHPNPRPKFGSVWAGKLMEMLTALESQLDEATSPEIMPEAVISRLYPEFFSLLPWMIIAGINLMYWKCSEARINLLDWESPIVRETHRKWSSYAYVFILASNAVDFLQHKLEPEAFSPLATNSMIHFIMCGICAEFDYMRTWLLGPEVRLLQAFELEVSPPLTREEYHEKMGVLLGSRPGFNFLHHKFQENEQPPILFCELHSMTLASQYFWTREDSIVARTKDMYNRYPTLKEYMRNVRLWEKRAPAIGLALFFSAEKAVMFSGLEENYLDIERWNKREIAIVDDFLGVFNGRDKKWAKVSRTWSELLIGLINRR